MYIYYLEDIINNFYYNGKLDEIIKLYKEKSYIDQIYIIMSKIRSEYLIKELFKYYPENELTYYYCLKNSLKYYNTEMIKQIIINNVCKDKEKVSKILQHAFIDSLYYSYQYAEMLVIFLLFVQNYNFNKNEINDLVNYIKELDRSFSGNRYDYNSVNYHLKQKYNNININNFITEIINIIVN